MNCGICGGTLMILGSLGRLTHFICRHCGAHFHRELSPEEIAELEMPDE